MKANIYVIAHNLRSTHNVGSLLRTAEGLGVKHVYLTGYTPYPASTSDDRLPHIARKIDKAIHKTALGAENQIPWTHIDTIEPVLKQLTADGCTIAALEQTPSSIALPDVHIDTPIALIVGREVEGIEQSVLKLCDMHIEIPMRGQKESFNVVQAAAMALYHLTYSS